MSIGYIETKHAGDVICHRMVLDDKGHLLKCRGEFCAAWRYRIEWKPPSNGGLATCAPDTDLGYCGPCGKPEHD